MLSIVIPTLNAAAGLPRALAALEEGRSDGLVTEIVVADGGSEDATLAVARAAGALLVETAAGRGGQLGAGAETASGDWLLFLHADTVLAPGWAAEARRFIAEAAEAERAAAFRFALDDDRPAARRLERVVAWRCRLFGLPYGDQGLLISKRFYRSLGGFRPLPLMEDVDLTRRIGRSRLAHLETAALTSAARYRRSGYLLRSARNLVCLTLYLAGAPLAAVSRLYG
ncbi:MAG: TIGR04283 family arsenosugar biosynthesis glycosyltransferase [Alphaproteobacteria bacterium]|jgi:rSAM/selenodomain-associated transferase 2|nr:TIGR04283 family arsenosugar biosynthesis glycosyltransferase [Alphaproteobacteria bacterium]